MFGDFFAIDNWQTANDGCPVISKLLHFIRMCNSFFYIKIILEVFIEKLNNMWNIKKNVLEFSMKDTLKQPYNTVQNVL